MNEHVNSEHLQSMPEPVKRRRGIGFLIAVSAAILLICGSGVGVAVWLNERAGDRAAAAEAERQAQAEERAAAEAEAERKAAEARALAAAQQTYDACAGQVQPLIDALSEVDARLDVGLNLDEYGDLVGNASVAYDRMDPSKLEPECIEVGVPLENALNKYIEASSKWNDCVWELSCEDAEQDRKLQPRWASAATYIERAKSRLGELEPAVALGESS